MEKKSSIIAIGLTVHSTPVEVRERLAVPEAEWPRAIAELTSFPHIEEAAVLSTCNRMELYIVALSQRRGTREVCLLSQVASCGVPKAARMFFCIVLFNSADDCLYIQGGLDFLSYPLFRS
jgi:glutamyl-tRNA reductase